jgi:hypothetical protein
LRAYTFGRATITGVPRVLDQGRNRYPENHIADDAVVYATGAATAIQQTFQICRDHALASLG